MADIPVTGRVRVTWVTSISDTSAPSVSELNAGTAIESKLVAIEGFTPTYNEIDTAKVNDTFDTKSVGSGSYSNSALVIARDDSSDTVATTLIAAEFTSGYLVMRLDESADNAWGASDNVEVYPVTLGRAATVDPGSRNTILRIRVPATINADPVFNATVAA